MITSMNAKVSSTIIAMLLAGCARSPELEFKKETLTGEEYCIASNKLLALKNSERAELSLKYTKEASIQKSPIKATLYIVQNGREYNINPYETLKLFVDGTPYPLNVLNSFQEPLEIVTSASVCGRAVAPGTATEITKRQMSFFLPQDSLAKMVAAKRVVFEISSPATGNSVTSRGYPIILEINPENISFLQEFKSKCISNFLNQSGAEK